MIALALLLLFGLMVVSIGLLIAQIKVLKKKISTHFTNAGGRKVQVTVLFDLRRLGHTFYVSYLDVQGIRRNTRCNIRNNKYQLCWLESLQLESLKDKNKDDKVTAVPPLPPPSTSKEQIISDLTTENQRLQAELEQLRQAPKQL